MHFQDSLPKLPLPALEDTMKRLRYSAEPLCTKDELDEIDRLSAAFIEQEGPALQAELAHRDAREYSSFITKPWFDMYLRDRRPVLLNHNPALIFADEEGVGRSGPGTQVGRAARLVHAAATFDRTISSGNLQPDVFHLSPARTKTPLFEEAVRLLPRAVSFYGAAVCNAFPLDMSQYANLLRSTRMPCEGKDELVVAPGTKHIIVQRRGGFYTVPVLDADGGTLPLAQLHGALQAVCDAADKQPAPPEEAIGLLPSLPRDAWTRARAALIGASGGNAASLAEIDGALFALSLEPEAPKEDRASEIAYFLHGRGVDRWLDKSFQLIVAPDGKTALNFEHSWGDGVAVMRFVEEVTSAAASLPLVDRPQPPAGGAAPFTKLAFAVDAAVKAAVAEARATFDATVGRTETAVLRTDALSSAMLKQAKLSPDGAMQMAFQLAHHRMHGGMLPSTYESASTAAFKHGRTETIRSATPEALAFVRAFADQAASPEAKASAMRAAVANHGKVTRGALMGQGMDRHLFALGALAAELGLAPRLLDCAGVRKLRHIILSTSTLSSDKIVGGGFGPVNDDCYAIGYGIRAIGCEAQVMTYGRDSQGFVDCLGSAMDDMRAASAVSV